VKSYPPIKQTKGGQVLKVDKSIKVKLKKKKGAPKWAMQPFKDFLQSTERLSHIVRISEKGISMIRATPKIIEVLTKAESNKSQKEKDRLKSAREEAKLAQQEVDMGFPVLHAWAVISLWAHLESLFRIFIATWLRHKRSAWKIDAIRRLRIKVGEYESIAKDERHIFIAGQLERELGAGLKAGVTRFETLLEPFGLSGNLPACVKRQIYEFGQVRNLVAHRAGKIDNHFLNACPWIDANLGTELNISKKMLGSYYHASLAYVTLIICRLGELRGVDMSKHRINVEKEAVEQMEK